MSNKSISLIIKELKELSDLLKIVETCQTEVPGMLYDLIEGKATEIHSDIYGIRKAKEQDNQKQTDENCDRNEPQPADFTQKAPTLPATGTDTNVPETTDEVPDKSVRTEQSNRNPFIPPVLPPCTSSASFTEPPKATNPIPEEKESESRQSESGIVQENVAKECTTENSIQEPQPFFNRKDDIFDLLSIPTKKAGFSVPVPDTVSSQKEIKTPVTELSSPSGTTLDDLIQRKLVTDIRKAISLNDRFRFKRELFANNEQIMSQTLDSINQFQTYSDALAFIKEKFDWDEENETVADFLSIVEKRFA